ncbi:hypothetical protein U3A58_14640 [Algoriphagus sp. C2-6-M1]|uniref:hypothetical protein n=1 Tax=Algoriphagus persicinus TaxID=3108754 RepID=UPI002B38EC16|nr:hypothetical protein [Algoriphagus sp. C2-6-M1]MEB2781632.1 hypothetical protein [Algoriphagus sp. C2-6-M1]
MKYSLKPDLWSKIQQRKDFDSQVKEHAQNLPESMPKMDLWNAIEHELDRKTPVIPLWKYGRVAASVGLILVLSGIAYLQFGEKDVGTQMVTEVDVQIPEVNLLDQQTKIQPESSVEKFKQIEPDNPKPNIIQKKLSDRETTDPIVFPKLDLPDLDTKNKFVSKLIIAHSLEAEEPETLHKVRISWGIQEKSKIRTTFGASDPEQITFQQTGRADPSKNSIKIKFQKQ